MTMTMTTYYVVVEVIPVRGDRFVQRIIIDAISPLAAAAEARDSYARAYVDVLHVRPASALAARLVGGK